MGAAVVPSVDIVHKVLNQDNYALWSIRVKTYLVAKDLWSVVTNEAPNNGVEFGIWSKKNAEALYVINICCGDDMFPFVSGLDTAKAAWDTLEAMSKPTIYQILDERSHHNTVGANNATSMTGEDLIRVFNVSGSDAKLLREKKYMISDYGGIRNALFIAAVESGNLGTIKTYLDDYPQVLKATSSSTGGTALHRAVFSGHVDVVKELVEVMSKEDLEVRTYKGKTALAAAACIGNIQMSKYMVEKNETLISLKAPPNNTLPLLEACFTGKWDLARYLYSVTPLEALTHEQNGREGAQLISLGIYWQEFDVALELIRKCPTLTLLAKDYSGNSPLYVLSTVHSALLIEKRLTPWQKLIYNSIQIQPPASLVSKNIEHGEGTQRSRITIRSAEFFHCLHWCTDVIDCFRYIWRIVVNGCLTCFRGLSKNLYHLLGINHIRKKKLAYDQTLEMLDFMCKETQGLTLKQMQENMVPEAILQAVKRGNVEFISMMCEAHPILAGISDGHEKNLLQFSIECRQEKVYCYLVGILADNFKNLLEIRVDKFGNSMLHAAGCLSSIAIAQLNHIQGAALQLQRELQWFKEVESIVPPMICGMVNKQDGMTARELFTRNHKEMVKEGERQMKEIATSSTVIGTLIVTIMFAAAFTVPGETNEDTGMANFLDKKWFRIFIVSDFISLISSTTSIVMFLGILTSRYAENDFLKSLPKKMVVSLSTLFISIATMMIAFLSALIIMLHRTTWINILIGALASIPIASFAWTQCPFLVEIFISTFGRGRFPKKN